MGLRFARISRQKFFVWENTKGFSLKHQWLLAKTKMDESPLKRLPSIVLI